MVSLAQVVYPGLFPLSPGDTLAASEASENPSVRLEEASKDKLYRWTVDCLSSNVVGGDVYYCTVIPFAIVERFIVIGRAFLDAPHRKVSTIVFLSSIVEVLPLFTSMGITQAIDLFYQT